MSSEDIEGVLRGLLNGEHSSATIGFNDVHACNYMTAQQWADQVRDAGGYNDLENWVSPEEREKALANNTVWSAHWYPDTPVGHYLLYASSLPALMLALSDNLAAQLAGDGEAF